MSLSQEALDKLSEHELQQQVEEILAKLTELRYWKKIRQQELLASEAEPQSSGSGGIDKTAVP